MVDHIASIRAKLTDAELAFLKETHGIDPRDPEILSALSELAEVRAPILAIEESALPHCSFCDGSTHAVGPVAKSPGGALICHDCAVACASIRTAQREGDA